MFCECSKPRGGVASSASGDEPIPPQYQDLVDRYYQVLASEGQKKQPAKAVSPAAPE